MAFIPKTTRMALIRVEVRAHGPTVYPEAHKPFLVCSNTAPVAFLILINVEDVGTRSRQVLMRRRLRVVMPRGRKKRMLHTT